MWWCRGRWRPRTAAWASQRRTFGVADPAALAGAVEARRTREPWEAENFEKIVKFHKIHVCERGKGVSAAPGMDFKKSLEKKIYLCLWHKNDSKNFSASG